MESTLSTKTRRCIAVVDDELIVREALSSLLRAAGYRVVLFASGEDFLQSTSVYLPDCVLVDCTMLGLSGLEVVSRLVAEQLDIPAIVIAAGTDEALEKKAIDAGARALLRKHIRAEHLFAAIDAALADRTGP